MCSLWWDRPWTCVCRGDRTSRHNAIRNMVRELAHNIRAPRVRSRKIRALLPLRAPPSSNGSIKPVFELCGGAYHGSSLWKC